MRCRLPRGGDPGGVARRWYGGARANAAWRTGGGVRARGGRALGWGARQGLPVAGRRAPRGGRGRQESHGELPCGTAVHGGRWPGTGLRAGLTGGHTAVGCGRASQTSCDNTARERKGERLGRKGEDLRERERGKERRGKGFTGGFEASPSSEIQIQTPSRDKCNFVDKREHDGTGFLSGRFDRIPDSEFDQTKIIHTNN